jgi:serine O-acetyltransferase
MNANRTEDALSRVTEQLSHPEAYKDLFHQQADYTLLPSAQALREVVQLARSVIFPGYFGESTVNANTLSHHIGVHLERLHNLLQGQVLAGLCFDDNHQGCNDARRSDARTISTAFIEQLPELRRVLATDVQATYEGDPAARSIGEVISCYPAIRAISNYRIAHALLSLGVPIIPRIITEMAHSETGIDINPGAQIGEYFSIDHGTGVVIGETCIIGSHVKLYQGVTLGARSFTLDADGHPVKGIARHPIIEDNVIVYSNATILGRITVGRDAVVGGNIWVTNDVAPGARITQR